MPTRMQAAFSKGEISPDLFGRVDSEMYLAALATARNVVCHSYGGVSNRAGLRYLGPCKAHTYAPKFIKFKFNPTDTYLLEFGDLYMRVIRENGHVTETSKTITGITAATPPVVTTSAAHGYSNGDEVYVASVVGMTQVNGRRFLVAGVTGTTFQLNDQVTNTAVNGSGYTAYTSGGTAARIYTVATPYAIADVANIKYSQAADVMTLTHQNYAPRELTRTGHAAWAFSTITFAPGIEHPTGLSDPGVATNAFKYKVTAVDKFTEEESLSGTSTSTFAITNVTKADPGVVTSVAHELTSGDEIEIQTGSMMSEIWGRRFEIEKINADSFSLRGESTLGNMAYAPPNVDVTAQTGTPGWLWFKPDGLVMYVGAGTGVWQYTLSTAWDVSTAVYAAKTYNFATVAGLSSIFISPDGVKIYASRLGVAPTIYQYTMSTPWDVTTITYDTKNFDSTPQDGSPTNIWFSPAGTTMMVFGDSNNRLYQYSLSTAWDISTASYSSVLFDPSRTAAEQLYFRSDGLKFFIQQGGIVYQYSMSTAWSLATASSDSKSFDAGSFVTAAEGFFMHPDGNKYLTVSNTTNLVQSFPIPTVWDVSSMSWVKDMTFRKCFYSSAAASGTLTWTNVPGADKYNIYHANTVSGVYGYISQALSSPASSLSAITPDFSKGPPTERNPFLGSQNYPTAVGNYEQRQVFGGSTDQPDTSFYSKIGTRSNFSPSFPTQADDAIQATLVSNTVNEIRHYVSKNDLIVLTEANEWKVNSGPDSGFSPDTIKQKPQSEWGSSHLRPQTIGDTTLFVPVSRLGVRSLEYSFQTNGYETSNVSTLAPHMFRDYRISDWDSVKSPDPLVATVREDGDAPVLTLDVKAETVAWARWDTLGSFESVGSARAFADDQDDTIYFVTKRTINGQTVRNIEYLAERNLTDVRDSFFVDCGVTYDVPITISGTTAANPVVVTATAHGFSNGDYVDISDILWTPTFDAYDTETQPAQLNLTRFKAKSVTADTFELTDQSDVNIDGSAYTAYVSGGKVRKAVTALSGLWHLIAAPVTVLADGVPVTGHTVSSTGTITLANRASRVHIGLKYTSDVETLNIETPQVTSQGKPKKITQVSVRFRKSRGVYYGRDFTKMHELTQTDFGTLGATPGLFTGDIDMDFPPDWESNGRMAFRQRLPLPMTISAVIPDFEVGR